MKKEILDIYSKMKNKLIQIIFNIIRPQYGRI
jgi:hypothetical protein